LNTNKNNKKKIDDEKIIVKMMIYYYCKKHHSYKKNLCFDCTKLKEYAFLKLDNCFYGENKPVCSECKIHCYSAPMRKKIKNIMRYSGPRMVYIHPVAVLKHLKNKMKTN
jgi:hypothetical protein